MSVLQIFVTPEELDGLVKELATTQKLSPCYYEHGQFEQPPRDSAPSVLREGRVVSRLFLLPENQVTATNVDSSVRPREAGWLDIVPGRLVHSENGPEILTLTTVQAEDKKHLPFKPTSWLRSLKKNLSAPFEFGVRGTNVAFGGGCDYKSIGYSRKALGLHETGVVWKYQVSDNTVFEPLETTTIAGNRESNR